MVKKEVVKFEDIYFEIVICALRAIDNPHN